MTTRFKSLDSKTLIWKTKHLFETRHLKSRCVTQATLVQIDFKSFITSQSDIVTNTFAMHKCKTMFDNHFVCKASWIKCSVVEVVKLNVYHYYKPNKNTL